MLKYITQDEYMKLLGTKSVPNNFNKLVIEASNYINVRTFNRIDENNVSEIVKYVTCLIVDLLSDAEAKKKSINNLKSSNIEGWSETYKTDEEINTQLEKDKYSTLKTYLSEEIGTDGLPLLYRGVC